MTPGAGIDPDSSPAVSRSPKGMGVDLRSRLGKLKKHGMMGRKKRKERRLVDRESKSWIISQKDGRDNMSQCDFFYFDALGDVE